METELKKNIIQKLNDKGLTQSSIKLYVRNLEKLNDDTPLKNLKFLSNPDIIVNKLQQYKPNTIRGYLIAITASLNAIKGDNKQLGKLYEKYAKLMIDKANEIRKTPANEMSDTQKANWIGWGEVEKVFNSLKEKVDGFIKSKDIYENQYNILLSYVILALYFFNPPRRNADYQLMNLVKVYTNDLQPDKNYLSYDDNTFIFNVFKTAKKEGQVKVAINQQLRDVIDQYLKFHPLLKGKKIVKTTNVPFLVNFDGTALARGNCITRILNKVFDKKIGSSMLRHIFLTDKYGDKLKEQQDDAKAMGHSVETQAEYIKN
jgi:hypothetical protein